MGTGRHAQGKEGKVARAVHRGPEFQAKCVGERLGVGPRRSLSRRRPWSRFSMERSLWGQKDGLRWTSRKWSKLSVPIFPAP